MISCEKDGPYIGFSHCPVCSAKYATEMGKTIRALETALAAMTAERDARDVAIGVLAKAVYETAWQVTDEGCDVFDNVSPAVKANELARAAVEGGK